MKESLFGMAIAVFLTACVSGKTSMDENYLPSILEKIKLGMTLEEVLKLQPSIYPVNSVQETPRILYTQEFKSEEYESVFYFFSKTNPKILVEINILHQSKEAAEKTILEYFGEAKNKKQNQWHKTLKNKTIVHATWEKKKVFIYIEEKQTEKPVEE